MVTDKIINNIVPLRKPFTHAEKILHIEKNLLGVIHPCNETMHRLRKKENPFKRHPSWSLERSSLKGNQYVKPWESQGADQQGIGETPVSFPVLQSN